MSEKESYRVFIGGQQVVVSATSAEDAFLEAKKAQLKGPFRNAEEQETATKEKRMTGKVYCPNGDKAIFDELGSYLPGQMLQEFMMHDMFSNVRSFADELFVAVDESLRKAGGSEDGRPS